MVNRLALFFLVLSGFLYFIVLAPAKIHLQDNNPNFVPVQRVKLSSSIPGYDEGEKLFKQSCARCHSTNTMNDMTGPALYGFQERIPTGDWIYRWIRNSQEVIESGDVYANMIWEQWGRANMDPMDHLSDEDIDKILVFLENHRPFQGGPDALPGSR